MEGWLFWYSIAELSLPIRAQLTSLIFAKSLRRKDVKTLNKGQSGAHKSCKSKIDPLDDSSATVTVDSDTHPASQAIVNLVGVDIDRTARFFQFQFLIVNGIVKLIIFSGILM